MSSKLDFYKSCFNKSEKIHLNNAGLAPISSFAFERIRYWGQKFYEEGFYSDLEYMNEVAQCRTSLAELLKCKASDISYFQSTAGAISQIAFQFGLEEGDEVLLWDQEYSSNLYPWQVACRRSKANLVLVASPSDLSTPLDKLFEFISPRTKIISVSWVQFQTGAITELAELMRRAHEHNIFVVVDVMQGLGLFEFDLSLWQVDAVVGGSHKWLTSPVGVGFLALPERHRLRIEPHLVGSGTYGTCDDPASLECLPKSDGSKYEPGSKQVIEITALGASVKLILQTGVITIGNEALRLADRLRSGLHNLNFTLHSPYPIEAKNTAIVNFTSSDMSTQKIGEALTSHPINFALRGPGIRLSPHAFNTDEEIDRVIEILSTVR